MTRASQPGPPIRRRILYSGHVQGVGFRYSACRAAEGLAVAGYVRNLAGGDVEVEVEGSADQIDRFLRGLMDRMGGYVRDVQTQESPATGEFDGFDVRY